MLDKLYNKLIDNSLTANRMFNANSYALCNHLGNHIDNFMRGVLHITDYGQYTYFMDLVVSIHEHTHLSLVNVEIDGLSYTMSLNSMLRYLEGKDSHPYEYAKPYYYYPDGMINNLNNTHLISIGATQQFVPLTKRTYEKLYKVYEFLFVHYCKDLTWGMFLESLYETCCDMEYNIVDKYSSLRSAIIDGYNRCSVY